MYNIDKIKEKLISIHSGDKDQTDIIFDDSNKIIVEAPAGCGKTKTMISKIAYILSTNKIESSKKILALTFSVNASYKIKKDLLEQLPDIFGCETDKAIKFSNSIVVSNYHGFCRKILLKYGYLLSSKSIDFSTIKTIPSNNSILRQYDLNYSQISEIISFSNKIKKNNFTDITEDCELYNNIIKLNLLNKGVITFDGILSLTLELLKKHSEIKRFYNLYYPVIFVDEFQDSNCLAWNIIKELITENTKILIMGDSLQRIYGFIGAIPSLMKNAEEELNMIKYELSTNYRFKNNLDMLLLDKNIRLNSEEFNNEKIIINSNPLIFIANSQEEECDWISKKAKELENDGKVAILTRNGIISRNTQKIKELLDFNQLEYFYGLFTDEDENYVEFHQKALNEFNLIIKNKNVITRKIANELITRMKRYYSLSDNIYISLLKLLSVFFDKIFDDYKLLSQDDKIMLITETFENKALRQNMDKINEKIILTTIHASKGLEFENVIMPDVEKNSLPSVYICQYCDETNIKNNCKKNCINNNEKEFLEELSIFYVGFTRAKKNVYFSLSKKDNDGNLVEESCFLKLRGIDRNNISEI